MTRSTTNTSQVEITTTSDDHRVARLAALARADALDTPAWRAHYVCLSLASAKPADSGTDEGRADGSRGAATVLERAGLRKRAVDEALGYLRVPDEEDDALTSLATRAAFLRTLTCLGRSDDVSRATLATIGVLEVMGILVIRKIIAIDV